PCGSAGQTPGDGGNRGGARRDGRIFLPGSRLDSRGHRRVERHCRLCFRCSSCARAGGRGRNDRIHAGGGSLYGEKQETAGLGLTNPFHRRTSLQRWCREGRARREMTALQDRVAREASRHVLRARFNPELNPGWFSAMTEVVNNVSPLSVILAGAALIRE